MDFLGFLQAIGAATRLDISAAVQDGGCSIVFSDSLEVTFEHDEQNQKIVLFAPVMSIGEWPAESREHMLSRVLEVHLFGMATDGNYFGFDPLLERILFFRSMALPQLEAAPAIQAVESFVDQLERSVRSVGNLDVRCGDPPGGGSGFWAGVNTSVPNRMIEAAFLARRLGFAKGYTAIRREVRRGESRLDALLTGPSLPPLWVECKNVTLVEDGMACFPDAATVRGQKHLRELMDIVSSGERGAMFYLVQRPDGRCFGPIDVDTIVGRAEVVFWPPGRAGRL